MDNRAGKLLYVRQQLRELYPFGVSHLIEAYYADIIVINADYMYALCEGNLSAIQHIETYYRGYLFDSTTDSFFVALRMGHIQLANYLKSKITIPIPSSKHVLNDITIYSEKRIALLLPLLDKKGLISYINQHIKDNIVGFVRAALRYKPEIFSTQGDKISYQHAHALPEITYCFLKYRSDIAINGFTSYMKDSVTWYYACSRDCMLLDHLGLYARFCFYCMRCYAFKDSFVCYCGSLVK